MTGTLRTYGIFLVKALTITVKQDKEAGWVYDIKWAFSSYAREDRKFEVEDMRLLQSAAKAGGIKLECTPLLEGTALEPAMIPTTQRGNITISDDGEVVITTRTFRYELEDRGIGVEMILSASNCLECTADEQQTLEESIQSELKANAEEDAETDMPFPPGNDDQGGTGAQA
ncbi:hypothetical protein Q0M94_12065 [Deinococcus radiomollis]|uniref:hypothetical protein n=1 Tax=Deinococcus radiomollis TaxID=468916 RepID=UPI0038922305